MNKGEIRNAILDELEKVLGPAGFRIKRKTAELVRKTSSGRQCINFALYDINPIFEFSLIVSMEFDAIEKLFFAGVAHDWQSAPTGSLWPIEIHNSYFFEGLPDTFRVKSVEQIQDVISILRPGIVEKMIPFFYQCEELAALERIINDEPDRCMNTRPPYDAFIYIMSSFLVNRERFDEVVAMWSTLPDIAVVKESHREELRKLLAYMHASVG